MELFKSLSQEEVPSYKKWARGNYKTGEEINQSYHPVVQKECHLMNIEALDKQYNLKEIKKDQELNLSETKETLRQAILNIEKVTDNISDIICPEPLIIAQIDNELTYEKVFHTSRMKVLLNMSLEEIYLDYVNNFVTLDFMASHYGVTNKLMASLYYAARTLYFTVYPPTTKNDPDDL